MDINITVQHKVDPAIVSLLSQLLSMAANPLRTTAAEPAPEAEQAAPAKPRARKPAAAPEAAPAAAPAPFVPAPPAAQPSPVPIAAVKAAPAPAAPAKGPSMDELAVLVKQTLARIGTPGTRAVFNQFGVGRLLDLKPEQATAFAAALQAAEAMVATS